jgi:putative spermidine/putrescine transport system permease protein
MTAFAIRSKERAPRHWLLLLPLVAFLAIFFAYPLIDTVLRGFGAPERFPTLQSFQRIGRPLFLELFLITFEIALGTALLTLALSYPLAYAMLRAPPRLRAFLNFAVLLPFFTSILVRTYAWIVILGPQGVVNKLLAALGLSGHAFLYTRGAVLLGMTYALLPYMTLTLYSVFRGIDLSLLRAAHILGASDWQGFRWVFLPLSLPGVAGGFLLVFLMALGYFITPSLMGGPRDQMISMVIYEQVNQTMDWQFASALSVVLLLLTVVVFIVYNRLVGMRSLLESRMP